MINNGGQSLVKAGSRDSPGLMRRLLQNASAMAGTQVVSVKCVTQRKLGVGGWGGVAAFIELPVIFIYFSGG